MSILGAVCGLTLVSVTGGHAVADKGGGNKNLVNVQLLTFNDFHGHLQPPSGRDATLGAQLDPSNTTVGGAEYLAATLSNLRANATNSITATAGDLIGGSPFLAGLFHDEPAVESLNAMGLDVSSVGNHEFDEGIVELQRMQHGGCHPVDGCYFPGNPYGGAAFPWLAANVVNTATGEHPLAPTWVKDVDGTRVGFIGMTLRGTPDLVAAAGIRGLSFQDEVNAGNAAARDLKRQGVKAIVVLIHEGGMQAGTYGACVGISGPIVDIASRLDPEIDMIATGHTHQPYVCSIADPAGQPRMVTSASSFGRVVTESWLTINRKSGQVQRDKTTSVNHLVARTMAPDAQQTAIIAKWRAISAPIANRVVGSITNDITRSSARNAESALANLIADAQLAATDDSPANAQIALMNPGGVRANLTFNSSPGGEAPGEITYGEAFEVQPFGNTLMTITMTGAQVKAALEQQAPIAGHPTRNTTTLILGISQGLTFTWSASASFGNHVGDLKLDGQPIDPAANYQVTINSFLADGGDGFSTFNNGSPRIGGGDDLAALTTYLGVHSPVAPPPTDRITEVA